jgi:hypothetical protein
MHELSSRFNNHDWYFSTNTHRTTIIYGPDRQQIDVSFQENQLIPEKYGDTQTYHIVFTSLFFGVRPYEEKSHRELCHKTLEKIRWRKQGFVLEDGAYRPLPSYKMLRRIH